MRIFVALLALVAAPPATADPGGAAEAYIQGRFLVARDLGREAGGSEGLGWACRAGLVIGGYASDPLLAAHDLHEAIEDCSAAAKLDPAHPYAAVSRAIALGFEGKRVRKSPYVKAARAELEAAVTARPKDAFALAALGGWHAAVARSGFLARTALGASRKVARDYFEEAMALMPSNLPIRFEYLKFLATGDKAERAAALEGLIAFETLPPSDAFDRMLIEKARPLTDALRVEDKKAIEAARAAASAFDRIEEAREALDPWPLES